jgi:transcription initiation factor TFIIIB Brf1 subunit/transcription initiation factor TFIIB
MDLSLIWEQVDSLKPLDEEVANPKMLFFCPCGGRKDGAYFDDETPDLPTCSSCGRCDDQFISDEPEWRSGMNEDGEVSDPSRVGAPTDDRYSEMWSMGTIMSVKSNASYALKKLARIDFHTSMNHKDRSLFHNYADIEKAGQDLPKHVVREAEHMYKRFTSEKLTRGAVRTGIKANCLLQACKQNNIARSIAEMASYFKIPTKDISRTSELFREVIVPKATKVQITMASDVAARMFNDFTMLGSDESRRLRMKAISTCKRIQESSELMGKTPKTIAATVIKIILEGIVDLTTVCQLCDVSAPTIKKTEATIRLLSVVDVVC